MILHIETPLVGSCPLSVAAGRSVWLKLDALQPSGSFKMRGIGHACETYLARGARRFVSSSGGKAGLVVICQKAPVLERFKTVLVGMCGGASTTVDQIRSGSKRPD